MKLLSRAGAAAFIAASVFAVASAQAQKATPPSGAPAMRTTPTTRILAIGHLAATFRPGVTQPIMSQEVRDTVELYLNGKISEWYVRKDQPGVVFILEMTDVEAARTLLGGLPLAKAGQLQFDFIPLGPLAPLSILNR